VTLSRALASSRIISFCLTASQASPRAWHPVFSRLTPGYLGGKLRSACDPWSVLARPEPPGRLHSSTGSPHELLRSSISRSFGPASALSGLLRGLFSHRSTSHWEQALGLDLRLLRFSLAASWTYVWASRRFSSMSTSRGSDS